MPRGKTNKMRKSARKSPKKQNTRKKRQNCSKNDIVKTFLEMLNVIKLYHWKTHSHPEHISTDSLHEKLQAHVDKFVEVYLGKDGSRINKWNKNMKAKQYEKSKDFKRRMYEYRDYVISLKSCFSNEKDSDLSNIIDEILADLNQFLYLLTLK
jgi:hypothetical protein